MDCVEELAFRNDEELKRLDPLVMNLLVAKGIRYLAYLDVSRYQRLADRWAADIRERLQSDEEFFWQTPQDWKNDLRFFRVGVMCQFVDEVLGVRYREDHKAILTGEWQADSVPKRILPWDPRTMPLSYADPATLFLHAVIDSRRGTCANMAALLVALAWRLDWPLSLACAWSHVFARYDDGKVRYNIEATNMGIGGFSAPADEHYIKQEGILPYHIWSGSDLTSLRPRQMLGLFIGMRGRYYFDCASCCKCLSCKELVSIVSL